ncbi:hypothetical protein JOC77_000162 [Peribacillus deserti]|uniref:Sporulation protein Cse60 n=1 Tax=Peribacillus deserti TaxID=673318 RepID=A0ABS2QCA6_9BACI|nr:hypothetical protein [Peribacillus deserti]MBM7690759.1 hypothetical protein [Peribacillus deserti]
MPRQRSLIISDSDRKEFQQKLDEQLMSFEENDQEVEIHFSTAFNEQFNYLEYIALLVPSVKKKK